MLDRIKIIFYIKGRLRFRFHFQGDDILYDYLRKEVHKTPGAHLKSYSSFTQTALVIFDEDLIPPHQIAQSIFRAVEEFALKHPDCQVGEEHSHEEHNHAHNHQHEDNCEINDDCGHDHSASSTPTGIRKEVAKLALTGVLLALIAYRKVKNQKSNLPPGLEFLGLLLTIINGYPIFKSGLKTLRDKEK